MLHEISLLSIPVVRVAKTRINDAVACRYRFVSNHIAARRAEHSRFTRRCGWFDDAAMLIQSLSLSEIRFELRMSLLLKGEYP